MKLSTRSRYGLRLLIEVAKNQCFNPLYLKDIAKNIDVSEKYLSQIILPLKSAGIIANSRGAHSGYVLAKPPEKIDLFSVLSALEGDINIVDCICGDVDCIKSGDCTARKLWEGLSLNIKKYLENIDLQCLLDIEEEKTTGISNQIFRP